VPVFFSVGDFSRTTTEAALFSSSLSVIFYEYTSIQYSSA